MTPRAIPAGAFAPGRFNHAGLDKGKGPDKGQPLALQVGSWEGAGQVTKFIPLLIGR